jgi:hypothetical protein
VSATPVCRVSGSPISRVKALLQLPGASPQSPRREPTQATRSLLPPPGRRSPRAPPPSLFGARPLLRTTDHFDNTPSAGCAAPYAVQLTTRRRYLTAVDDPAHRVSERATFINFAAEPRYCFTSYQEAAGTRCSTRKFTGSAPKWRRSPSQRSSNTAWASLSADSSTSPSTSLTRNTERVDSLSSPL